MRNTEGGIFWWQVLNVYLSDKGWKPTLYWECGPDLSYVGMKRGAAVSKQAI